MKETSDMQYMPLTAVGDRLGLSRRTTLAKIGTMDAVDLMLLENIFRSDIPSPQNEDWGDKLDRKDFNLAKRYGFDVLQAIEHRPERNFISFGSNHRLCQHTLPEEKFAFYELVLKCYPFLLEYNGRGAYKHYNRTSLLPIQLTGCTGSCYFAQLHDDQSMIVLRGEILFILNNKLGHQIYSKDRARYSHVLTPQRGDIIYLDVHAKHAVIPNQSQGMDKMRRHRLKFYGVYYA